MYSKYDIRGARDKAHKQSTFTLWDTKCIEIAYSKLSTKENQEIMNAIDSNWDFINEQIDKTFAGKKFEHMTRIYSILDIMNITHPAA